MAQLVKFVLVGPNAGKTKGFSKDHVGNFRYNFVDGVMEMHPTRVNGRFIKFMEKTYSAVLEGVANGQRNVSPSGDNAVGSKEVHDKGLTTPEPEPASRETVKLSGGDDTSAGKKKRSAKRD